MFIFYIYIYFWFSIYLFCLIYFLFILYFFCYFIFLVCLCVTVPIAGSLPRFSPCRLPSPPSPVAHQPTTIADIHLSPPCASHFLPMLPLFHHFSCLYKGNILLQLKSSQSQPKQAQSRAFIPFQQKPRVSLITIAFQPCPIHLSSSSTQPWQIPTIHRSKPTANSTCNFTHNHHNHRFTYTKLLPIPNTIPASSQIKKPSSDFQN